MAHLREKNAILTGGSQGIGPFIAGALAREGVHLALVARSADKLEAEADKLRPLGIKVVTLPTDLTSADFAPGLVAEARARLGPIDIVVHNAGWEGAGAFEKRTPKELQQILDTNLRAPLLLTQELLPEMRRRRRGQIVTVASVAGKLGCPYAATYGATKAALIAWSAALRVELDGTGVGASLVSPGFVSEAGMFAARRTQAPGFLGQAHPQQVADAVVRAIRHDLAEVVVSGKPFWPVQLLATLAPNLVPKLMKRIGLFKFLRHHFDEH